MAKQHDSKGDLRAAFTMRELENAKLSVQAGIPGVFVRVALGIVFMYLVVVSNLMLGIAGPVFISVLFLIAFLVPYFYQTSRDLLGRRGHRKGNAVFGQETTQEG